MLGQCAKRGEERAPESVEEMTCVFSKSIEILHGMKESMLSICTPLTDDCYVETVVDQATEQCFAAGHPVLVSHKYQAVDDLINLTSSPDCWEDLCD